MAYTHSTWGQLKAALALQLSDPNKLYWKDGELGLYLAETLRTWAVLTGFWRDTGVINTVASTPFYDLKTLTNAATTELLSYTVVDEDIAEYIQYHFLEPATGNSWTGSEQFTAADLAGAIQKSRDQLISDTGCVVTRLTILLPANQNRLVLSDRVIALRRVSFIDSAGVGHPMFPADIFTQRNYASDQLYTSGDAYTYSSASARPTEIMIVPPTSQNGTLDILAVQSGATFDPASTNLLGIPDDYVWGVKWGAMADLLAKDGPARDPVRSAYCERRYQLAVELIKMAPVVVNAAINGVPLDTDSITNMDSYNQYWQTTTGTPNSIASIRTLVALAPCPDGVYSASFDVAAKAPIPSGILAQTIADDSIYVQLGKEEIEAVLGYAGHLAAFKMGGEEFRSTFKGAENFFEAALAYNERLAAANPNVLTLMVQSYQDDEDRPYRVPGGLGALQGKPASGGSATLDKTGATPQQERMVEG